MSEKNKYLKNPIGDCERNVERKKHKYEIKYEGLKLAFPTGRDSATFCQKGTKFHSLSQDKGTTVQARNLTMGQAGPGRAGPG